MTLEENEYSVLALTKKLEEQKNSYELKIKNLMNSINNMKNQNTHLENTSKDNIRVKTINALKEERKEQEIVLNLLRKMINDEEKVDKYLLKEFNKKGNDRLETYEELKIKIKKLNAELITTRRNNNNISTISNNNNNISNVSNKNTNVKNIITINNNYSHFEEKIKNLEEENKILTESKNKVVTLQNELFHKLNDYNKEIGDIKSVYDAIKHNLEEENKIVINDLNNKLTKSENDNFKLKEKIKELIKISDERNNISFDKQAELTSENEILKRLLESKKTEIKYLSDEMEKYQRHFEKSDSKSVISNMKFDREKEEVKRKILENEEKIKFLEKIIIQKDHVLDTLKQAILDKDELIYEKESEIELLQMKIDEFEKIVIEINKRS